MGEGSDCWKTFGKWMSKELDLFLTQSLFGKCATKKPPSGGFSFPMHYFAPCSYTIKILAYFPYINDNHSQLKIIGDVLQIWE